ncbi:MAG: InlB B-repeat-containing protein, partial [Clostridiales bacterium]|nr:InlB B-repeat-containing protein [Clostridiales bacterium]
MMSKKRFHVLLAIVIGVFCAFVSFGCAKNKKGPSDTNDEPLTSYTVTFHYNYDGAPGDGVYTTQDIYENETAFKPAVDPTRDDYTFTKWYKDAACTAGNEYVFSTPVTDDLHLYAGWEENSTEPDTYTVTFYYNYTGAPNGGVYKTETVDENTAVFKPTDPTRDDYDFTEWYTDAACTTGNEYVFTTPVIDDLKLYAGWEAKTPVPQGYTITFNANGGTVTPTSGTTGADGKLTSLPTPTRGGYTFAGWYTAAEGG